MFYTHHIIKDTNHIIRDGSTFMVRRYGVIQYVITIIVRFFRPTEQDNQVEVQERVWTHNKRARTDLRTVMSTPHSLSQRVGSLGLLPQTDL